MTDEPWTDGEETFTFNIPVSPDGSVDLQPLLDALRAHGIETDCEPIDIENWDIDYI